MWYEVMHTPFGGFGLFSLSNSLNEGRTLHGDENTLVLSKYKNEFKFNIKITTTGGAMYCGHFKRTTESTLTQASTNLEKSHNPKLPIKLSHDILVHIDEAKTVESDKALGYEIARGKLGHCE